jgi:hypothetical protein
MVFSSAFCSSSRLEPSLPSRPGPGVVMPVVWLRFFAIAAAIALVSCTDPRSDDVDTAPPAGVGGAAGHERTDGGDSTGGGTGGQAGGSSNLGGSVPPDAGASGQGGNAGSDASAQGPKDAPTESPATAPADALVDGAADQRPNRMFVTSKTYASDLGGIAGADAKCQVLAQAAALEGKFVALLSTATVGAFDRLGNSRGWIRTDGRPFADTIQNLKDGKTIYPPTVDELGHEYSGGYAATGTAPGGEPASGLTANDWSVATPNCMVSVGWPPYAWSGWYRAIEDSCQTEHHLYCLEVGHTVAVPRPTAPAGARVAFRTNAGWDPTTGLASADTLCSSQASAAGLPGAFAAFLPTSTATAVSRFDLTGPQWVRSDGLELVARASDLAKGAVMVPLALAADGQVPAGLFSVWTGAKGPAQVATESCDDWSSGVGNGQMGSPTTAGKDWFVNGEMDCSSWKTVGVYCFQK